MGDELRQQRRYAIGSATLRLAAERGIGAVSLRAVADTAGVSMGQVQHHFGTMADLTFHAVELGLSQLEGAIQAATGRSVGPDQLKRRARALIEADPERALTLLGVAQMRGIGITDARVADAFAQFDRQQREQIEATLTLAKSRRVLHSMVDPHLEADLFWTLMLTVAVEVAGSLRTRTEGLALVRYHFRSLARNRRVASPRLGRRDGS